MGRQQAELDRTQAQARRQGCEQAGFFQLFGGVGRSEQCAPLNTRIQQMRTNIARAQGDLQQLQGSNAGFERDGQRRSVLNALAQNDCGPQYRAQARTRAAPGNFFEQLFGGPGSTSGARTGCRRGRQRLPHGLRAHLRRLFLPDLVLDLAGPFPRRRADLPAHVSGRRGPAVLAPHLRRGHAAGGVDRRTALHEIPNAFKYKTEWSKTCTCKAADESWANAVKDDPNAPPQLGQGDIVVTEERAKVMNAPRDAKGRPILPPGQTQKKGAAPATAPARLPAHPPEPVDPNAPKKPIRSVGPKFLPTD